MWENIKRMLPRSQGALVYNDDAWDGSGTRNAEVGGDARWGFIKAM